MFQGASSLSLDAKGRLSVPTRHRDVLSATAQGQLTITKHPHGCLMVFPRPEWEKFRERIAQLPMEAQWWKRIFMGNAMDVDLDSTGRVLVSPELRAAAGIAAGAGLAAATALALSGCGAQSNSATSSAAATRALIGRPAPLCLPLGQPADRDGFARQA